LVPSSQGPIGIIFRNLVFFGSNWYNTHVGRFFVNMGVQAMVKEKKVLVEQPDNDRVSVIHLKGSKAYRKWLADATRETKYPQAVIVRWAVAQWAESQGLNPPPEL
jgi:hypothetical protein